MATVIGCLRILLSKLLSYSNLEININNTKIINGSVGKIISFSIPLTNSRNGTDKGVSITIRYNKTSSLVKAMKIIHMATEITPK